jgi:aminoglycoside phosphotransferase (APT) family kinase protein
MSAATPQSTPVPGIDVDRLTAWLDEHLPALVPPFAFARIGAGQSNLTYRLTDADGSSVVLRRPPLGEILASAHDMGREHTVLGALAGAGARVPQPLAICDDPGVCGAPFYVMEHVDGLVLSSVATAERLDEAARARTAAQMAETLAALHALGIDEIGLTAFRRPDSLGARQLRRWTKQWHASKTRELPDVDEVGELLAARLPEEREQALVHGDYHLGNALVSATGDVNAILDWELCTVGDPLADVGLMVAYWGETAPSSDIGSRSRTGRSRSSSKASTGGG